MTDPILVGLPSLIKGELNKSMCKNKTNKRIFTWFGIQIPTSMESHLDIK